MCLKTNNRVNFNEKRKEKKKVHEMVLAGDGLKKKKRKTFQDTGKSS